MQNSQPIAVLIGHGLEVTKPIILRTFDETRFGVKIFPPCSGLLHFDETAKTKEIKKNQLNFLIYLKNSLLSQSFIGLIVIKDIEDFSEFVK